MSPTDLPPRRRLATPLRLLARELGAFGVVGMSCFVLDLALFQLLYAEFGAPAVASKLGSTLVTMIAAYLGHRFWSFSHRARTGLRRGFVVFATVNGLTLALGLAIVAVVRHPLGQESVLVLQGANVASIALGSAVRFLAYRRWVFPAHPAPAVDGVRSDAPPAAVGTGH